MRNVINRVNGLLRQDQTALDLLSALYEVRNALVHRGHFPDEQGLQEVDLLKYIVERTINALFARMRALPTKGSLMRFYDHIASGDTDLADRQRVISFIRRSRAKAGQRKA